MEQNTIQTYTISEEKTKSSGWAMVVSVLLHPLLMTTYGVALLFVYTEFRYILVNQFLDFMLRVMFFSCIIPLVSIYFYKRGGYISSMRLERKGERILPLFTVFLSYALLFFVFYKGGLSTWFLGVLLVPIVLLMCSSIIHNWWKISTHMIGIGGLLGSVLTVSFNKFQNPYELFILLFILVGVLGAARLRLHRETPAQVYVGFLLGLFISSLTIFIAWYLPIIYLLYIH